MKIAFFGTPDYCLPILKSLPSVIAVVTQKPKPVGRKKILTYSPIDKWAHKKKLSIFYSSKEFVESKIKADLGILASYGEIIPKKVINMFPHGILNIHPSLLPKFRGASPVRATIVSGEKQTGVSIIKLDEELDHGPIISQFTEPVQTQDTTETLRKRLFEKSAEVLSTLIEPYIKNKITPRKQDHKKATFTTQIIKKHAFIPPKYLTAALAGKTAKDKWNIPFIKNCVLHPTCRVLHNYIRAMKPWPIAWTEVTPAKGQKPKRLKILKAHLEAKKLVLDEVQLEGKKPVSWKQFKQGYPKVTFE